MSRTPRHGRVALLLSCACFVVVGGFALSTMAARVAPVPGQRGAPAASEQDEAGTQPREWRIVARKYAYSVPRIEVPQDTLVKITLETTDIPHSFTIDEPYRIAKRATPGHPVVFEFRADKVGTFTFYCNLKADEGCRAMKGQFVVTPKR